MLRKAMFQNKPPDRDTPAPGVPQWLASVGSLRTKGTARAVSIGGELVSGRRVRGCFRILGGKGQTIGLITP